MPDHASIRNHKRLRFLGERLHEPNLWHLNRRSVSSAFAIGLFVMYIPVPGQMLIAATLALFFGANLPISVVLVWISNPITMPPMFYFAYQIGVWLLGLRETAKASAFADERFFSVLEHIWQPFLLGCFIVGAMCSVSGYILVRILWRVLVIKQWNRRRVNRKSLD